MFYFLVNSEFRGIIRKIGEKFIHLGYEYNNNVYMEIFKFIVIRFVASLFAESARILDNKYKIVGKIISIILLIGFIGYTIYEIKTNLIDKSKKSNKQNVTIDKKTRLIYIIIICTLLTLFSIYSIILGLGSITKSKYNYKDNYELNNHKNYSPTYI